ncbi:MAG: molecular chaperone DnaK, partial [Cyanobacteria bacterium J06576_12]
MGKVVGIDLGTTNSVVAVMEGGKPVVIANAEGMRTTPSVVAFSKEGEKLVGQMARRQSVLNPKNTFYAVKRFVGRRYYELSSDSKRVPYTVRRSESGNVKIRCDRLDKDYAPEEISAMILRKLAEEAAQYLGQPVTGAVITVPAYFNDAQRQATRDAGRIAGLEVKRIINEPTAASLAYGLDQQYNQTILVFDLGGGTFDVSVLDVGDGVFEVRSTSGDTQLGGLNFDKVIVDWLAEDFLAKEGVDLRRDRQSLQRLSEAAEKAKIELSGVPVTEINLPFITATKDGPKHIETKLERSLFEELCGDLLSRMRGPLKQALNDAGVTPSQVDEVVLVGGASRMPMVQELVYSVMNRQPNRNVNPDEVVAIGAAIQAGILSQEIKDILLLDVSPLSLGLETVGGVMKKLIPRNTTIPVRRSDTFSTSENNQTVVEVHILQGEREMVNDNKSLGRFKLMGIPPAPRGIPQVQVSFDIDANGILQVSALDKTTGRQQSITVQEASNLSEDEIQGMIREAEENSATDRLQRDRIEKRNRAEALTFKAERVLREVAIDFGMQFGRDRRRRIEGLVQELRAALEQRDDRGIDIAQADLQNEVYELNREAYLYDLDDEGDGILGQIGDTLKRAFAGEDDDYYRNGDFGYGSGSGYSSYPSNPYSSQAQWDTTSWNQGRANTSSWDDDWDDDWENGRRSQSPPASNPDPRYQPYSQGANPSLPYDQSPYNQGGYNQGGSAGQGRYDNQSSYQGGYSQGRNAQDRNAQDRNAQSGYGADGYNQGNGQENGAQRGYDDARYADDRSRSSRFGGGGRGADYRNDAQNDDWSRSQPNDFNRGGEIAPQNGGYRQGDYPQPTQDYPAPQSDSPRSGYASEPGYPTESGYPS